ncbi:CBS domain-containing protein [Desulfatiferula olefinivorans]
MKTRIVKEYMIPIADYATVSEDATMQEAISRLQEVQKESPTGRYPHFSILVFDAAGKISGKVSPLDIVRSLEPKYRLIGHSDPLSTLGLSRFGLSPDFLKSMIVQYNLWDDTLEALIAKSRTLAVKEFMYTPLAGEYVQVNETLADAIHQIVLGHHHSLLVMDGGEIVGVLRMMDIFSEVCELIGTAR